MAQHDLVLDNAAGAVVRADLNNALQALGTLSSGATEPATKYAYQLWADITAGKLKIRNAANTTWIIVGDLATVNLGLADLATANEFTASQKLKGDALLWRFKDTGASGVEWGLRSDGGNLELCENTGTEGTPIWKVRQIIKRQGTVTYALASGTDTYTASMPATVTEYIQGQEVNIKFANANAATAPTLNLDSVGAKKIFKEGGAALSAGDIPTGHHGTLSYDTALDTAAGGWILLNPKAAQYSDTSIQVGNLTRDLTLAAGTQAITGVGFTPKAVIFFASRGQTALTSWGMDRITTKGVIFNNADDIAGRMDKSNAADQSIVLRESATVLSYGKVESFDADGFTISWTKAGTPVGSCGVIYMAFRI